MKSNPRSRNLTFAACAVLFGAALGAGSLSAQMLSVNDASANEGSNVTFTVTLSASPSDEVTVDYATSVETGDTAATSDFTSASGTVTFASGASDLTQTFTVAATDDVFAEGAETFTVTLTEPASNFPAGVSISDSTGVGTINASDAATVSVNSASANEGSNVTFTVTLSGRPGAQVVVDYATSVGGSDTAVQADFTNTTGSVTFAAEATDLTETFTVAATNDVFAEGAETFTVTLSAPSGGFPGGISLNSTATTGTGTINASDAATLSVNDASANEGSNVSFTVTLSGSPASAVTVNFATSVASGNTAAQSDFTNTTGSVTFAAGATGTGLMKTFTVATTQDTLAEGAETFTVTISGTLPAGVTISDSTGVGTINASDAATLSVNDASAAEGSNVTFTVTLSGTPGAEVTVNFATSVASGNTAAQSDFTNTTGSVTFASGATGNGLTKTFTVATTQDALAEGAETFTVTISGTLPGGITISDATGVGTINASDAATLSVNDSSANEGSNVSFTVTLSGSPGAAVTVDFATSVASGNTAVQADFTSTTGTVTFASGATGAGLTKTFTVAATDDALAEGAETFTVTISEPSGNFPPGISINDATGVGTINASDAATLSVNDSSANEGSNATFTVTLSGSPGAQVTVDFATSIASGNTAASSDFTSTTGTVTFAAEATGGGLTQTFTVATTDDARAEGAETFTVTISEPSSNFPPSISISDSTGTGTINASDPATLSVIDATGGEGANVTFTVNLSGSPDAAVTVDYATSIETGDTAAASDFTSTSGTLTFAAGATGTGLAKTFTVALTDDELVEGRETFTVTLTAPSGGFPPNISINDGTAEGAIDAKGSASLSVTDTSASEGGNLTFTVTLSARPGNEVTVNYATSIASGNTALQSDFTSTSGTVTIEAGARGAGLSQTFTVAATDDNLAEGPETFTVTLTEPSSNFPPGISLSKSTGTGTINASDPATLSVTDASGGEGGDLTFAVTLSGSPGADVIVDYATSTEFGDTAGSSDYTSTSGSLTFATGATGEALTQAITVPVSDDELVEGDEEFTMTMSAPAGGLPPNISISEGTSKGTITASGLAALSVSDASTGEGGRLTFTVALSASPADQVTVNYATSISSDDTASASDFESASGTLTFAAEASGTGLFKRFTVDTLHDGLVEGPETFTVTLSPPLGGFPAGVGISVRAGTSTGTIRSSGSATLSVNDAEGPEGSDLTFTVTLSASSASAVTVDYAAGIGPDDTA